MDMTTSFLGTVERYELTMSCFLPPFLGRIKLNELADLLTRNGVTFEEGLQQLTVIMDG